MGKRKKNILIAYLPSRRDLGIAQKEHWYRIPVSSYNVPIMVKNKTIEIIAFYLPKVFGDDAFQIKYYGKVSSVTKSRRRVLLKDEPPNDKSEDFYYKIGIEKLLRLPYSIYSRRRRRILFIATSLDRFQKAKEINDLFMESPLEEKFWSEFKRIGINAERQYFERIGKNNFYLDFALFCRERKLAIECDGDKYHTDKKIVQKDKRRDNLLESNGWNVLRYTTNDIIYHLDDSIRQVKETVNRYGGLEDSIDPAKSIYFPNKPDKPTLFDDIENTSD